MKVLRIWLAALLGMIFSMVTQMQYSMMVIIFSAAMMSMFDRWTFPVFKQLILGSLSAGVQANIILGVFPDSPVLMATAVSLMMLEKCFLLNFSYGKIYGLIGLIIGSILLCAGGYSNFQMTYFTINLMVAILVSVAISAVCYWILPDPTNEQPNNPSPSGKQEASTIYKQTLLAWTAAMSAFFIYQFLNLMDSFSAYSSILVILMPLTMTGIASMAKIRIKGTLIGCGMALVIQTISFWFAYNPVITFLAFAVAAGIVAKIMASGGLQASVGTAAMSGLAVPIAQYMVPHQQDAIFKVVYRISSITFAMIAATTFIFMVHWIIEYSHSKYQHVKA